MADPAQDLKEYQDYQDYQAYQAQSKPAPDMSGLQSYVQGNLKNYKDSQTAPVEGASDSDIAKLNTPQAAPRPAESFFDAFEAGMQMSVSGLIGRKQMPDTVLPENAGMAMRILSQAGQLAGDAPAMLAGGIGGAALGSEAPIVGNVAGAAAGAWGLPAAMRRYYMDAIQKGDVKDFGDFFERASGVFMDSMKAATVGVATEGMGELAGGLLAKSGVSAIGQTAGTLGTQLGVMTTVGKAMDGQVPHAQDFVDGALLMAGLHGVVKYSSEMPSYAKTVQDKLQEIYAQTGVKPGQVVTEAQANPVLKQEMMSSSPEIPKQYQEIADKPQPGQEKLSPPKPEMTKAEVPPSLSEPSNVLGKSFAPDETPKIQIPDAPPKVEGASQDDIDKLNAKQALLDRVGEPAEKPATTLSQVRTRALDDLNPLKNLTDALAGGKELSADTDPFKQMREARAYGGMAETFIDNGPRDFETQEPTGTPGLKEILKPFKGDLDGFTAYAIGARALELEARGVKTGVPLDQAKEYVDENKGKYEKGFQQLVGFQNDMLGYLRDSGVISKELHDQSISENQSYIPFNRIQETGEAGGGKGSTKPIKKIFGSELKLVDPVEQVIKNTYAYTKIAERNRAQLALVDLANKTEEGQELVQRVAPTMKPVEVKPEEIAKYMTANGIQEGDPDSFNIFRPLAEPLAKDEIAVMREGKREVYNVGEDVAKALNATDYQAPNVLMKAISIPAKLLRTGAVETIDFLSRHFIRDQVNAYVMSNNDYVPVIDALKGLKSYFTEDKNYQEWMAGGGGMANVVSMDRDYIQGKISELSKETGLVDKATNVLKNPLQIMQAAAEAITSAPRLGEFAKAREAGKSIKDAAYDSRNVTIDNQKMGSDPAVRAMSLISAFWNTHIQGVDRMVQAFKDNPAQTMTKMSLAVTLPSVLLWAQNHDDPRYQAMPRWEKDLFWIVMTKDHIFRIPKPFEQGILFGSMPERMLESFYAKNPDAFKGFGSALMGGALPNMIPTAFQAPIEQFSNRSFLTGGNVVPHSLEKVAPAYQYNPYTSETAKMLGKMISYVPGVRNIGPGNETLASPMVIQNYVRAWGGGMGQYALQLADKALSSAGVVTPPDKPASALEDMPIIKSFMVRYPSGNSQPIQDFYDNFEKTQSALETAQHLAKTGDLKALSSYTGSAEAKENMVNLTSTEKALSAQNKMIQLIYSNPQIKPDEKRQQIDGIYNVMIQTAQAGNKVLQEVRKMSAAK